MRATILAILALSILVFAPVVFSKMDCANATHAITFFDACRAAKNCTLSAGDLQKEAAFTRLKMKSCNRRNDDE